MNLEDIIINECDPCDIVDRLELTSEDIVRAFGGHIRMMPEAFEDLRGCMEMESMYNEIDMIERDDDPIEDDLMIIDTNLWEYEDE